MLLTLQSTMWFSWTRGWKRKTKKRKLYNGDSGHCFYVWVVHVYLKNMNFGSHVQQWIAASFMALKYKRIHRKTSLVTLHLKGWSPFWEEAELSLLTSRNISVACWWNCSLKPNAMLSTVQLWTAYTTLDLGNFLLKGIVHKKILWLNLIFWDMMGCGIAHFGRRGLKTT